MKRNCLAMSSVDDDLHHVYPSISALRDKSNAVGWNFFWQQPGNVSPYFVGVVLLLASTDTSFQFRTLVGLGAVPTAVVLWWNIQKAIEEDRRKAIIKRYGAAPAAELGEFGLSDDGREVSSSASVSKGLVVVGNALDEDSPISGDGSSTRAVSTRSTTESGHQYDGSFHNSQGGTAEEIGSKTKVVVDDGIDSPSGGPYDSATLPGTNGGVGSTTSDNSPSRSDLLFAPDNIRMFLGTGGTWFLFDVAYYGTMIFTPFILQKIFPPPADGGESILLSICTRSIVVSCFQIPGTICGLWYMNRGVSPKTLNSHGFLSTIFCVLEQESTRTGLCILLKCVDRVGGGYVGQGRQGGILLDICGV